MAYSGIGERNFYLRDETASNVDEEGRPISAGVSQYSSFNLSSSVSMDDLGGEANIEKSVLASSVLKYFRLPIGSRTRRNQTNSG